jgi:hypothetical protein
MASLHGILAELGLEPPDMHPEREIGHANEWIVDQDFSPVTGESYDIAYGRLMQNGEERPLVKHVRIDGPLPAQWVDLGTGEALEPELRQLPVKAFRMRT